MVEQEILGFTPNSEPVILYTLTNIKGERVKLINIGAAIVSAEVTDKSGNIRDVVLGYRTYDEYLRDPAILGKSVGRCAGRIEHGRFTLNDKQYRLTLNSGNNHINGGAGFQTKVWGSRVEGDDVIFSYQSIGGDEGYPGELGVEVTYEWSDNSELLISYTAIPSQDTIVNLTSHTYFNLDGECSGRIDNHTLQLYADNYLPLNREMIPTGDITSVEDSVMDFREPKAISKDIEKPDDQLTIAGGYNHCWAVNNWESGSLLPNALLYSSNSGIKLAVSSTLPGVEIESGNRLFATGTAKCGNEHDNREGLLIACQYFPDSINKPQFPTVILKGEEIYYEQIKFTFSVE